MSRASAATSPSITSSAPPKPPHAGRRHAAGVSPRVLYADANALVIGFIEGKPSTPEDVRAPRTMGRLIDLVRRAHREIPKHLRGPASAVLGVSGCPALRAFAARTCAARMSAKSPISSPRRKPLEQAVGPVDLVFGHNDLLAANIIDDGKKLWLVDWEYAGFNSPLFDLGGLASNSEVSPRGGRAFGSRSISAAPVDDALRQRMAAMTRGVATARDPVEHGLRAD